MGRHTDKEVHFANANQFAKEIIGKKAALVQTTLLSELAHIFTA
jgi:hypothetical protein